MGSDGTADVRSDPMRLSIEGGDSIVRAPIPPERVILAIEGWNAQDLDSRDVFERSLGSILDQSYHVHDCQILVLLDAAASEEAAAWVRQRLPTAEILRIEGATYYRAKNRAMQAATGDVLVFADSDVRYTPDWLEHMLRCVGAGHDVVVGNTQYENGPLSRTLNLCDWAGTRIGSGPTDWIYGNNLAMARTFFKKIRFRSDMGTSGGGAANVVRDELSKSGMRPWFCESAQGWHHLAPFWPKRLRIGAYRIMTRRWAPGLEWSWLARVPLLSPFLVTGATAIRAWGRAWRLRTSLPGKGLTLPLYLGSIAVIKSVELLGALLIVFAPSTLESRYGWFDVPAISGAEAPPA